MGGAQFVSLASPTLFLPYTAGGRGGILIPMSVITSSTPPNCDTKEEETLWAFYTDNNLGPGLSVYKSELCLEVTKNTFSNEGGK